MTVKGYLASHFFDIAGFEYTAKLAKRIREETNIELYVPQENGEINDKKSNDNTITDEKIYKADTHKLLNANILIASLDGTEIDPGVASEIGVFAGYIQGINDIGLADIPRVIIGYLTDMRKDGTGDNHLYRNLYTTGAVNTNGLIVYSEDELIKALKAFFVKMSDNPQ